MLKKLLATSFAASLIFSTPSFADEIFYQGSQQGSWNVFGNAGSATQNAACVAEVTWDDGSKLQLIKDLISGEIYIWFQNMEWNVGDPPGTYPFRMNIVDRAGNVVGGDMNYELVNKNTIAVRGLDAETFIPPFMGMSELRFIMPGDIGNAYVPLNGSTAAVEQLLQCMDTFKNYKPKNNPLNQNKVPGQDA